ncbi:hypothetical protein [Geobacillus jurassicus]|uniref:Uncharacterized protein n=1 Tax=Geobacillus jurassicus TaxID=235932 RepID=A0ABV6GTN0_9BACL|nr:hypothetical protein [Geobacillus jurassicus]
MKTNKWVKWVAGLGGVALFTAFLQLVDSSEMDQQKTNSSPTATAEKNNETMRQREQELMSLDWNEGNWDVQYSNEVITLTPKGQSSGLPPSENRTRRS